jgi:hypothetical protein
MAEQIGFLLFQITGNLALKVKRPLNATTPVLDNMTYYFTRLLPVTVATAGLPYIAEAKEPVLVPFVRSVSCIWNAAPHCAFTDLIEYKGHLLCSFRESDKHVYGTNGIIRILRKDDEWRSVAQIDQNGIDLRDPHFSVTFDNRLMLIVEGVTYVEKKCVKRVPYVCFSDDGIGFSPLQEVSAVHEWIWRVTWNHETGYAVSYKVPLDDPKKEWKLTLFTTFDGLHYTAMKELGVTGHPSETTIRFLPDNTMVLLVRRGDGNGLIGTSKPPYTSFNWKELCVPLGGPNFLILPNGEMWAASRVFLGEDLETTAIGPLSFDSFEPTLLLMPFGYDASYPGMVYKDGTLYVSFYWSPSDHEAASIYLAEVALPGKKRESLS